MMDIEAFVIGTLLFLMFMSFFFTCTVLKSDKRVQNAEDRAAEYKRIAEEWEAAVDSWRNASCQWQQVATDAQEQVNRLLTILEERAGPDVEG